ncbi:hypothetical protein GCM10010517_10330 [Streptosporangium fragile]|uniref:Asp23/Gls24 family envelope stress response protein n=1 Tax=Streptosporangium fragile TaxID=46186 RepID=A0ABN3VR30_9ACTN
MTDVSVEDLTDGTGPLASPLQDARPHRPFSLSLSAFSEPASGPVSPAVDETAVLTAVGAEPTAPDEPVVPAAPAAPLAAVADEPEAPAVPLGVATDEPVDGPEAPAPAEPVSPVVTEQGESTAGKAEPMAQKAERAERKPVLSVAEKAAPAVVEAVSSAVVKGRIKVADEVVEKVAALATLEVAGVAALGEGVTGPGESSPRQAAPVRERAGARRSRGVSAHVQDRTVAVDVAIVAEYGHVVMDVANEVKTNVARTLSRMLGMRVVEVNVNVDDVRLPGEALPGAPEEPEKGD